MIKCLILDLDGTLIDTSALMPLRDQGRWGEIWTNLHLCAPFSQVTDVLHTARAAGIKVSVVTNAPSNYAQKLLNYFDLKVDFLVAYHDVRDQKPDKEGIVKVLSRFGLEPDEAVFLGDSHDDYLAAQEANVEYFAVEWSDSSLVTKDHLGVSSLLEFIGTNTTDALSKTSRSEVLQSGRHFFLGYYLDGIKQEVWAFKDGSPSSIDRWLTKAEEVSVSLPHIDYVVRALGHAEIQPSTTNRKTPLDELSEQLARSLNATYCPGFLKKDRLLVKSTQCSATERKLQVDGVYSVNHEEISASRSAALTFLIVDDVFTSGATTSEIIRALHSSYPKARIYIFTLIKTIYRLTADGASAEAQHNSQLFNDLYSPTGDRYPELSKEVINRPAQTVKSKLLTKQFSANYVKTNHNFVFQNVKSYSIASEPKSTSILDAISILRNVLQRGKPTLASRKLREAFGYSEESVEQEKPQALISPKPITWQRLIRGDIKSDQYPAKRFFDELVLKYFGEYAFIKQLMLPEVQIFDMTQVYVDRFNNRQVDFFVPQVGLIIEIDGPQHRNTKESDEIRDAFTQSLGLETVRFTTEDVASENDAFLDKIERVLDHIRHIEKLENSGVLNPPNGLTLQHYKVAFDAGVDRNDPSVRLTAAIRFQLLLLELIESGDIRLGEPTHIVLINHDQIDFATQAVDDLSDYLNEMMTLLGIEDHELQVRVTEVADFQAPTEPSDVIVDFSILERFDDSFQTKPNTIFVRTHYFDFYRYFTAGDSNRMQSSILEDYDFFEISCTNPIVYDLDLSPGSRQRAALMYFLCNLFLPFIDDADFREGQIGIIGSALARNGTIGLLPTGAGKSICYQLSAILQPAISFVVCPIKSLMYDQKADLDSVGFTRCNFITGDLSPEQKAKVQSDYGRGKYFFVFISPERFQTRRFRSEMRAIGMDRSFSYAVIDEAHCLSEWGHDFRTSYLNLSNAIDRLAPEASYIGLTATASVNVLKDIQTEFGVPDENVRTPLDFSREELSFHVIDDRGHKREAALKLVNEMESKWNAEKPTKAGIIFTSTVNGDKGCFDLAGFLSQSLDLDVHYFSGSAPKYGKLKGQVFEEYKRSVQRDFKANKYRLLTATKAFGMGVNKGNIAYTIHFGIPGSMEALYQEAGRAGRDKTLFTKAPADCYVLLTREENTGILDQIWDASAKVTDLKSNLKKLSRESDINTNLWLMTNSLDTINDEYKLMYSIYNFLKQNNNVRKIVIKASQFSTSKFKFERAIYRISQIGVVSDWVVDDFFKGELEVEFICLSEGQLRKNLEDTIRKYEPTFRLNDLLNTRHEFYLVLNERLNKYSINKTQYMFLVLLVWSYDHFVYNRRQSLKTVYEQCGDLAARRINEQEFKFRLESYFKFNNSTLVLHSLTEGAVSAGQWLTVFFEDEKNSGVRKIISESQVATLKEQISRFLESYKDNPCLNYLSGILRLVYDQFDDADGERRMSRSLDQLANHPLDEIELLVKETLKLKALFSSESQRRFAKLFYEKFPEQRILELINSDFEDAYSYRKLLEPMLSRLEYLSNRYKGIIW
jgi:ATP-dependent DNA helicase RecQ